MDKNYPLRTVSFLERETDCVIASPAITDPDGLNGKKIGLLRASSLDVLLTDQLQRHSFAVSRKYFRTPNEMIAALRHGDVDAITLYVPLAQKLEPDFKVLHWFGTDHPRHPCCNIVVNTALMDLNKTSLIREICNALERSVASIGGRDRDLLAFMMRRYGLTETQALQSLEHTHFIMGLDDEGKHFEAQMAKLMADSGYLSQQISPNKIYWEPWE
ncbi:MAG: hypothetical protein PHG32_08430 [Candidatus Cloacimonetes bacterium]|nr:hypothetical protein [Candidatus Cloacimonadota bacterium]